MNAGDYRITAAGYSAAITQHGAAVRMLTHEGFTAELKAIESTQAVMS